MSNEIGDGKPADPPPPPPPLPPPPHPPRARSIEPPLDYGDYDYRSPTANRDPGMSSVTSNTLIGHPSVWICERENLLATLRAQDAPFDTQSIPPGMNRQLTQEEVDLLNEMYPT